MPNPYDALQTLLQSPGARASRNEPIPFTPAAPRRSQSRMDFLRQALKLPMESYGEAGSQAELEDTYNLAQQEEDKKYREQLALAGEPARVAGAGQVALEQERGRQAEPIARGTAAGKAAGEWTVPAQMVADAQTRREQQLKQTPQPVPGQGWVSPVTGQPGAAPAKLNQAEQGIVDMAGAASALGEPLLDKYVQKYPGIAEQPNKYGSPMDVVTAKFGKGWYSFGGMTENDPLLQESAAIEAWGMRALAQGRINTSMMDIIKAHLPQPGFSPGANYDRLQRFLREVLPAQLKGIGAGHLPFDPSNPLANYHSAPSYVSTDPNRGR